MRKNFILSPITAGLLSSALFFSSTAMADNGLGTLTCTAEEVDTLISEYNKAYNDPSQYQRTDAETFKMNRMITYSKNSDNLCDLIMDPNFDVQPPDWNTITSAYDSLMAAINSKSSSNYYQMMMEGAKKMGQKGMAYAQEGMCKLTAVGNEGLNKGWADIKDSAESTVVNSYESKKVGINDLSKPMWKQVAKKETEEQLQEYSGYAKWYEDDFLSEDNDSGLDGSINDLINDTIGDKTDEAINNNVDWNNNNITDKVDDELEIKW